MLRCMGPLLAPLRHANRFRNCPLIGVDRKWRVCGQNDAIDPTETSAGLKSRGAAVSCHAGMCYRRRRLGLARPASIQNNSGPPQGPTGRPATGSGAVNRPPAGDLEEAHVQHEAT
jgi:hypothetical protein